MRPTIRPCPQRVARIRPSASALGRGLLTTPRPAPAYLPPVGTDAGLLKEFNAVVLCGGHGGVMGSLPKSEVADGSTVFNVAQRMTASFRHRPAGDLLSA